MRRRLSHRLTECDGYRIRYLSRPFPEKLPALEAEYAPPESIQVDRDHRRIESLGNLFEPTLERQQVSGPRDRAFGENTDDVAL